jgi:proteic killer suppression protein
MIKSFRHKGLEKFFRTGSKAGIQPAHANKLNTQLTFLNIAERPSDMAKAGWGLHPLHGIEGRWSVWVSGNWRLTFEFAGVDVVIVDYEDYH